MFSKLLASRRSFLKRTQATLDDSTILERALHDIDSAWSSIFERLKIIPGKSFLSMLNQKLQAEFGFHLSGAAIINCFDASENPNELVKFINAIDRVCKEARSLTAEA